MKYVADDGKAFSTEAECLAYENDPHNALAKLITSHITASSNDDAGFSIIEEHDVLKFIVDNLDEINKIMKTKNKISKSGEWISNIGHRGKNEPGAMYAYPSSLDANKMIEVLYNDKTTDVGWPVEWNSSWDTVTRSPGGVLALHIIAYRIIG